MSRAGPNDGAVLGALGTRLEKQFETPSRTPAREPPVAGLSREEMKRLILEDGIGAGYS